MFDELKEVKYFVTDFYSLKILYRNKTSKEPSKSRGAFRTQTSINNGAFLWIYLTAYYFRNKSFIVDVRLVYM